MQLTHYPHFAPITLGLRDELLPYFSRITSGISEFCFAGIYLFRKTYDYQVALLEKDKIILKGTKEGRTFCALPLGLPEDKGVLRTILEEVDYLKGLSEEQADYHRVWLEQHHLEICEDRDNFDYLYSREELASLSGKRFHKKRNQVNSFLHNYPNHRGEFLTDENRHHAYEVLEGWKEGRDEIEDYPASKEALDKQNVLGLTGYIVYVDEVPVAFTMGEGIMNDSMYVIHIEKGIPTYKGVYQYINQAYAEVLPERYALINREQDLGDQGLRQAKMTYRPIGFSKKFRVYQEALVKQPFYTRSCDAQPEPILDA